MSRRKEPLAYQERDYRCQHGSDLLAATVKVAETDLHVLTSEPIGDLALLAVTEVRAEIEAYIRQQPQFLSSLTPLPADRRAPEPVQAMLEAGIVAGVGPMAAVAGVVAEQVGRKLLAHGLQEVIVENGGDIFAARIKPCLIAVQAGASPFSGTLGIRLQPEQMPCGVCCSSGTVGHSLSFGVADAAVAVAASAALADAAATRLGNEVRSREQKIVNKAVEIAKTIAGLAGLLVIAGDCLGAWGAIELEPVQSHA